MSTRLDFYLAPTIFDSFWEPHNTLYDFCLARVFLFIKLTRFEYEGGNEAREKLQSTTDTDRQCLRGESYERRIECFCFYHRDFRIELTNQSDDGDYLTQHKIETHPDDNAGSGVIAMSRIEEHSRPVGTKSRVFREKQI